MGQIKDDLYIDGQLSAKKMVPSPTSIGDSHFKAPDFVTELGLSAHKQRHIFSRFYKNGAGKSTTTAVSETEVVHVCKAVGEEVYIETGAEVAAIGAATVTVDLKKNGVSILTSVITLNSSVAARATVAAVPSSGVPLADGDVLEVTTVATAGGGTLPTGVFARVDIFEQPY